MKNKEIENILDQVTAGICSEEVDSTVVNEVRGRVWAQLSVVTDARRRGADRPMAHPSAAAALGTPGDAGAPVAGAFIEGRIEGCADFQSLIPAYLRGELSEPRSLLLVDHTHECIPCRKALKQARESRVGAAANQKRVQTGRLRTNYSLNPVILRWGIAAVLVIGLGLIALPLIQRFVPFGSFEATVQAADGPVYALSNSQMRSISAGERIGRGQIIRTAKDAHAMVRLGDGSTIELNDRSEFSITQTLRGTTLHLDRGNVIVEAAKQKGHLFVDTGDSLVSVTGTTFAVNAGTKGSRISVIEGEVHLDRNGEEVVLRAGQQAI